MIFISLELREGIYRKVFKFNNKNNLIFSDKNSKGKTTLLRLMLYSLGYNIPSTQKIDFKNFETTLTIENNGKQYTIFRQNNTICFLNNDNQRKYILPYEFNEFLSIILKTENESILNNLLGAFYFDQEKGWTLLNRGSVIGKNSFYIEDLIRGLSNRDCSDLLESANDIKFQIDKYKKMYDLSEYKRQLESENTASATSAKELLIDDLSIITNKISNINKEIKSINSILKENEEFIKYIEDSCISIKIEGIDELIPVNRQTIYSYTDNMDFILARKSLLLSEKIELTKQLSQYNKKLKEEDSLIDTKTLIEEFDANIMMIDLDQVAVQNVIKKLQEERNKILKIIKEKTKTNNDVIQFIYSHVKKYARQLQMEEYITEDKDYIFTKELKGLSGAVLHKLVFIFKMAYLKAIEKYLDLKLPIILDSPKGREVDKINVDAMFDILNNEFSEHQIIIASIFKDYNMNFNHTITIKNLLMDGSEIHIAKDG